MRGLWLCLLGDLLLEDYLGGRSAMGQLVMRGLPVAIVDEVDSILLDEAATPLIISGDAPNDESVEAFTTAATLAPQFTLDDDYTVNQRYREVRLTSRGRQRAGDPDHREQHADRGRLERKVAFWRRLTARTSALVIS